MTTTEQAPDAQHLAEPAPTQPAADQLAEHPPAEPAQPPAPAKRQRHRLDDPLTDWGLAIVGLGIQAWSTYFMWTLATWAYGGVGFLGFVNVIMYDLIALITARVGANPDTPSRKTGGPPVKGLAWTISAFCFAFTFAGNIVSHHILENGAPILPEYLDYQPLIRDVLGSLPVLLLAATLILRTMKKAYRDRVVAEEAAAELVAAEERVAQAAAEQERRQREEREAAERRQIEREEREAAQRREIAEAEERRQREEREAAERRAAAEHELELARIRASAAASAPGETTVRLPAVGQAPPDGLTEKQQALYESLPGATKREKVEAYVLQQWSAGNQPTGAEVDAALGTKTYGRVIIRDLKARGHDPAEMAHLTAVEADARTHFEQGLRENGDETAAETPNLAMATANAG